MSILRADCPRCGARHMTFDVRQQLHINTRYQWQRWYELFCVCRGCFKSTTFRVAQKEIEPRKFFEDSENLLKVDVSLDNLVRVEDYVSIRDQVINSSPAYVPPNIESAFNQGAVCISVKCWDAAGTMFRKCVDLATQPMLPQEEVEGLTKHQRRNLGHRLKWLFDNHKIPVDLRELSNCIREDGNDSAHLSELSKEDAEDLLDFTVKLLERIYSEPEKLRLAEERRKIRRQPAQN